MTTLETQTVVPRKTSDLLNSQDHKFGYLRYAIQLTNFDNGNGTQEDTAKFFYLLEEYPGLIDNLCELGNDNWDALVSSLIRFRIFNALCQNNKILSEIPDEIKKQALLSAVVNDATLLPPDMHLCTVLVNYRETQDGEGSKLKDIDSYVSTFSVEQQTHIRSTMYGIKLADKISSELKQTRRKHGGSKHNNLTPEAVVGDALYNAIKSRNWGEYTGLGTALSISMSGLRIASKMPKKKLSYKLF